MNAAMLDRTVWYGRRVAAWIGWPGIAGLLVLTGLALYHWQIQVPETLALRSMVQDADVLQTRIAAHQRSTRANPSPALQLDQFYGLFPEANGDAVADALAKLYAAAAAENLALDQGDYRLNSDTLGHLVRYDIIFPVKGNYLHLRRFLAASLKALPNLALESISFNRQAALDIGLDAQVRFTLYLRPSGTPGP